MEPTTELKQLTKQVRRLEQQVAQLSAEMAELKARPVTNGQAAGDDLLADKQLWRETFDQLFADLGIQATPIGAEKLQALMAEAGLEPNELSRDLIAMRDE